MPAVGDTNTPAKTQQTPTFVSDAAKKWGVPEEILDGVFGIETDFGANSATSSAGAVGYFQFLPSTARMYGYPLTNSPNAKQAAQQADSAAHYLHDLYVASHVAGAPGWDKALREYSGGGYGLNDVQAKAGTGGISGALKSAADAVPGVKTAADAVTSTSSAVTGLYNLFTDVNTWVRLGEAVFGIALIFFGLRELTR